MAIVRIEDITLHTSDVLGNCAENIKAEAFFERKGIPFTRIYYNDPAVAAESLNLLNTQYSELYSDFVPLTKLPVLQYVEVHDDIPARLSPMKFLEGVTRIQEFPSLYFSIGNP